MNFDIPTLVKVSAYIGGGFAMGLGAIGAAVGEGYTAAQANTAISDRPDKAGDLITQAPASEIMGGPLKSLRWLVSFLAQRGMYLKKGSLVIPGSPVELVDITHDTHLKVEIGRLGSLITEFKKASTFSNK